MTPARKMQEIFRRDLKSFIIKCLMTVDSSQPYVDSQHLDLIAHYLTLAYEGKMRRLIINLPPRSLKSIAASVAFPAFVLGHDPSHRIICASYSSDLAGKLGRDTRTVMEQKFYKDTFPRTRLNPKKLAEDDFETTMGGYRLATSVGGTLTGRGGGIIIIDDPIKAQDAHSPVKREDVVRWFNGTLMSRLDDKRDGIIIVIMQRVHVDDLTATLLEQGGWEILRLPAIADSDERYSLGDGRFFTRSPDDVLQPIREPRSVLDQLRRDLGPYYFNSQYQQSPVPEAGNLINWEWFKTFEQSPSTDYGDRVVQSWDIAHTTGDRSDYSVGTTWLIKGGHYYLIDLYRDRLEFPALKKKIITYAQQHGSTTVLVEDVGTGTAMIQQLRAETRLNIMAVKPEGCKADRMTAQSATIEGGRVFIPYSIPWLAEFKVEMLAFPHGKHDDQVDSLSQFLGWAENQRAHMIPDVEIISISRGQSYFGI